jgi:diguanylate cyclase (GGDEF)-like protein
MAVPDFKDLLSLQEFVYLDVLTGIGNRRYFHEHFRKTITNAKETNTPFSVAIFDLDHFRELNETYGHRAGDEVIKNVAQKISEMAGENTVVARYGGEEFIVVFPNMEREEAFLSIERIRNAIEFIPTIVPNVDRPISVTASAGVASFPVDAEDEDELLSEADRALYRAKALGRNKVRLAVEDKMTPKTFHFDTIQLERLSRLAKEMKKSDAELLREALNDLLLKYGITDVETSG